jgi:ribosomal protein L25 (general stress protein Ctc)
MKPGHRVLVLHAPDGYISGLGAPDGGEIQHRARGLYDVVQLFASSRADAERRASAAVKALKPGGVLWICWPKGSARVSIDLNRDILYRAMRQIGLQGVSNVFIDETWSALRFKVI